MEKTIRHIVQKYRHWIVKNDTIVWRHKIAVRKQERINPEMEATEA